MSWVLAKAMTKKRRPPQVSEDTISDENLIDENNIDPEFVKMIKNAMAQTDFSKSMTQEEFVEWLRQH